MAPKTSTRPLDMPVATWIANTHAEIAERIAAAEAKLASRSSESKAPVEPKAKEPKAKAAKVKAAKEETTEAKEPKAKEPKEETTEVKEPKEKKAPSEWIVFCGRVRALLKANEMPITSGISESTKFCSSLKAQKSYSEWSDEAILEARGSWVNPPSDNETGDKKAKKTA